MAHYETVEDSNVKEAFQLLYDLASKFSDGPIHWSDDGTEMVIDEWRFDEENLQPYEDCFYSLCPSVDLNEFKKLLFALGFENTQIVEIQDSQSTCIQSYFQHNSFSNTQIMGELGTDYKQYTNPAELENLISYSQNGANDETFESFQAAGRPMEDTMYEFECEEESGNMQNYENGANQNEVESAEFDPSGVGERYENSVNFLGNQSDVATYETVGSFEEAQHHEKGQENNSMGNDTIEPNAMYLNENDKLHSYMADSIVITPDSGVTMNKFNIQGDCNPQARDSFWDGQLTTSDESGQVEDSELMTNRAADTSTGAMINNLDTFPSTSGNVIYSEEVPDEAILEMPYIENELYIENERETLNDNDHTNLLDNSLTNLQVDNNGMYDSSQMTDYLGYNNDQATYFLVNLSPKKVIKVSGDDERLFIFQQEKAFERHSSQKRHSKKSKFEDPPASVMSEYIPNPNYFQNDSSYNDLELNSRKNTMHLPGYPTANMHVLQNGFPDNLQIKNEIPMAGDGKYKNSYSEHHQSGAAKMMQGYAVQQEQHFAPKPTYIPIGAHDQLCFPKQLDNVTYPPLVASKEPVGFVPPAANSIYAGLNTDQHMQFMTSQSTNYINNELVSYTTPQEKKLLKQQQFIQNEKMMKEYLFRNKFGNSLAEDGATSLEVPRNSAEFVECGSLAGKKPVPPPWLVKQEDDGVHTMKKKEKFHLPDNPSLDGATGFEVQIDNNRIQSEARRVENPANSMAEVQVSSNSASYMTIGFPTTAHTPLMNATCARSKEERVILHPQQAHKPETSQEMKIRIRNEVLRELAEEYPPPPPPPPMRYEPYPSFWYNQMHRPHFWRPPMFLPGPYMPGFHRPHRSGRSRNSRAYPPPMNFAPWPGYGPASVPFPGMSMAYPGQSLASTFSHMNSKSGSCGIYTCPASTAVHSGYTSFTHYMNPYNTFGMYPQPPMLPDQHSKDLDARQDESSTDLDQPGSPIHVSIHRSSSLTDMKSMLEATSSVFQDF